MQIKAISALVVGLLFAVGLLGAKPQTNALEAASARSVSIHAPAGKTVPMPDFFGSMLTTR